MDNRQREHIQSSESKLIYGKPVTLIPLVSIAIPTYKRLHLLQEAIESALSQRECSPYEIIILDNDQSSSILDIVNSFDPSRVAVYQNSTNLGMWGNMNRALDLAKGEWILLLHDDDLLMPNALQVFERTISSSNDPQIGCLAGGVEVLYERSVKPLLNTRQSRIRFPIAAKWYSTDSVVCVSSNMRFIDTPKFCSSFFRRQYIKEIGGWDAKYYAYADLALSLRIVKDKKLFVTDKIFGQLRSHEGNDSHPSRLWKSYPVMAAQKLLKDYADETTVMGRSVYSSIERCYTTALWKRKYTAEERRTHASELLRLLNVKAVRRRFLMRNVWLVDLLSKLYSVIRPRLGSISQIVFGGKSR